MLKFIKMELNNFLSFEGHHEFNFQTSGMHLIKGFNLDAFNMDGREEIDDKDNKNGKDLNEFSVGSGKSSLTFGPQFALYGEIEKGVKKDEVINKFAKKDCMVAIEFEDSDKEHFYRIERYRKDADFKNKLRLLIDDKGKWKDVSRSSDKETQEEINQIIIINSDTFLKSILFSREDKKQFFELIGSEKIKIFENIIQLSKFKKYLDKKKKEKKSLNDEISSLNLDITSIETVIRTQVNNAKLEKTRLDLEKERLEGLINDSSKEFKFSLEDMERDILFYYENEEKINNIDFDLILIQKHKANIFEAEHLIDTYNNKIEDTETKIAEIKPIKCIKCGEVQNPDQIEEMKKEYLSLILSYKKSIENFKQNIKDAEEELSKIDTKDELITQKAVFESFKQTLADKYINIEALKLDIESAKERKDDKKELEIQLKALDYSAIDRYKAEAKLKKVDYDKLVKERKTKEDKLEKIEYWIQVLDMKKSDSLKQHVMSNIIPIFNNIFQEILNEIYDGKMQVTLDNMLQENITYQGKPYTYRELSTGEKLKLNLAMNLSIFDLTRVNLAGSNIIFLDEIFSNVDADTVKKFLYLLEDKYSKNAAIYLISHLKSVMDNLDEESIIKIEKENERSQIII